MYDAEKIHLFIRLAETGSFHRTAQSMHVSPSKLSRVIQALEADIGTTLFARNNRHVALTADGEAFLAFAREESKRWDTFRDRLQSRREHLSGTVSIYCSVTASYSFLYDILAAFRERYPLIQVKLHTGDPADAIERVHSGHEDIAVAAKPSQLPRSLTFKQFDRSPLKFFTAKGDTQFTPQYQNEGKRAWSQIPMILSERGLARQRLNQWFVDQGITPNIYAEVSGNEAIVSMVSLGCGIGLVPQIVVDNSPLAERVEPFCAQAELDTYEVGACVQSRRLQSPLVKALWDLI